MSSNRRSFTFFATTFVAAVLVAASVQSAGPQPLSVKGPQALRGQEITFTSPQFVVHALWFKSNDETGWYWTGSDEVYAVFSDMDPTHSDAITSTYGDVDEGETRNFLAADRCMGPQPECDRGSSSLNLRYSFWEQDGPIPLGLEFCPGWLPGSHDVLENGKCDSDDLIGKGSIILSQEQLVAMLPTVGASGEFTAVMDKDAGKYRFRYRITRLADVERSIVIHLPPDLGLPPAISLQGTVATVGGPKRVALTWSGATTSTVDIYRDGAKIVTTANDGAYDDPRPNGTYQYRLCNLGSTTACSPNVSITVM